MKNKKIKVLETIRQGKIGGGETHVLELCNGLDKDLFEPVVLSFTPGPMVEELQRRGIRTEIIHTENPFDLRVWKRVKDFMLKEKFDLVHAHGTRAMSNVFFPARKLGLKVIYTVHGWSFHKDQKYPLRRLRELSERFLTGKANKTICVSKSNEHDGIERFNMKRSTVIYNSVNLKKFNPDNSPNDFREEQGIASDKTVIGFIARMTGQKDPLTMVKAMGHILQECRDIVLLMVGDGELKEKTMQLAKQLGVDSNIIFQPFRTDIPRVLNAIDIYCLPSLWEGFPIGILEAMAMKKCVIASPVDGTRELIEDGVTGLLVENGNPDKLADIILMLHKDAELRQALAEKAYQKAIENYDVNKMVASVQDVYRQLAD